MPKQPAVYILTSKRNGTLYYRGDQWSNEAMLGTQEWSGRRVCETIPSSPARLLRITPGYDVSNMREKQLKKWNRAWKLKLIEKHNPNWKDLWQDLTKDW